MLAFTTLSLAVGAALFVLGIPPAIWWLSASLGTTLLVGVTAREVFDMDRSTSGPIEGRARGLSVSVLSVLMVAEGMLFGFPMFNPFGEGHVWGLTVFVLVWWGVLLVMLVSGLGELFGIYQPDA